MIKLITIDLWDTLISDNKANERKRDLLRTDFIIKIMNLPVSYREKILDYLTGLTQIFKHPSKENEWALLPETQLLHLFKSLNVNPSSRQFEEILKFYTECALDSPPSLTEKDVPDTLKKLKEKYKLALISNTGKTPGKVLRKILEKLNILSYFDMLIFSDEVKLRKPDPKIFLLPCRVFNVLPEETVHIGDSERIDFYGAKNAKVNPLLYAPMIPNPGTNLFVRSLKEIENAVDKYYNKN